MCSCLVLVLGNPHLPSPLVRLRIGATASLGGKPFRCGKVIMIAMSSLSEIRYTLGVWISFLTIPDQISSESNQLVKSDSLEVLGRVHSWSRNIEHSRHSAAPAPHTSRFWKGPSFFGKICLGFFFSFHLDMWNIPPWYVKHIVWHVRLSSPAKYLIITTANTSHRSYCSGTRSLPKQY